MKTLYCFLLLLLISLSACGGENTESASPAHEAAKSPESQMLAEGKGIGEIKDVELKTPLETERVTRGKAIYEMKSAGSRL